VNKIPPEFWKKRHKYGAERSGGRASKKEHRREGELRMLERGGEIQGLRCQVKVPLYGRDGPILTPTGQHACWVADFVYADVRTGEIVYEDAKGFQTPEYKLKRAILAAQGIKITET
jgi:hypothetical protein